MAELDLVIPVYNEGEVIGKVLDDWVSTLRGLAIDYKIRLYNDGSQDDSLVLLQEYQRKFPQWIEIIDQENLGHGPSILRGYRESLNAQWIFQVDSDNEIRASHFEKLWHEREHNDLLIGNRLARNQPAFRFLMTRMALLVVRIFYGKSDIKDVNSPYRLMRVASFKDIYQSIPQHTFAPNIIITGMAIRSQLRIKKFDLSFQPRSTGTSSLNANIFKLLKGASQSFYEIISYSFRSSK